VEARNFGIRKHVLEYDDVMNKQREVIYTRRKKILGEDDLKQTALDMIRDVADRSVDLHINPADYPENWDLEALSNFISSLFSVDVVSDIVGKEKIEKSKLNTGILKEKLLEKAYQIYEEREKIYSSPIIRKLEKIVMLNVIDSMWKGHLLEMDYLKEGIGLRAIGQRDPLVEYKREAFGLFKELIEEIRFDTVKLLYNARIITRGEQETEKMQQVRDLVTSGPSKTGGIISKTKPVTSKKIGRNDPCPCGSGKKYKKCCGR